MNSANYITVTEFKNWNPEIDFTRYADATISGMIARASKGIDSFLQYSLSIEDISNEKDEGKISSDGNLIIHTRKIPIVSVSSLVLSIGTTEMTLNLTDGNGNTRYDIPTRAKYISYPYQEISLTGTFSITNLAQLRPYDFFTTVSYRAGYETIPDDIKDACDLWTKDIFIRQANPMDLKSTSQGSVSITHRDRDPVTGEGSFMKQAKAILSDYKRLW